MAQIKCREKRTGKHDGVFEGYLIAEDGVLKFVQVNDYDEVIAEKKLEDAFSNFLNNNVKIKIEETEKEEEEIEHDVDYL